MGGTIIEQVPAGEPAAVAVPTSDEQLVATLVDRTRSEGLRPAGEGAAAATDKRVLESVLEGEPGRRHQHALAA
ncbi:hypothetical protein [Streptomyces sp. NPDC015350]|uniref:hypothetical protein n=1 Tax=Streptomyces sp. NPDC015350 TaxID=3364955 RepID=UPI0036F5B370